MIYTKVLLSRVGILGPLADCANTPLLLQHKVVFFRGQKISAEQIGPPLILPGRCKTFIVCFRIAIGAQVQSFVSNLLLFVAPATDLDGQASGFVNLTLDTHSGGYIARCVTFCTGMTVIKLATRCSRCFTDGFPSAAFGILSHLLNKRQSEFVIHCR
jgi:hypothetical protein